MAANVPENTKLNIWRVKMSDNEVNKIIAEFMGYNCDGEYLPDSDYNEPNYVKVYTKSLDALVPVWGKLREEYEYYRLKLEIYPNVGVETAMRINMQWIHESHFSKDKTIQQAAAHATAKAIFELKMESKDE